MCLLSGAVYAQTTTENQGRKYVTDNKFPAQNSGIDASYLAIEDGWGLGANFMYKNFTLGLKFYGMDDAAGFSENYYQLGVNIGYNLRYWLGKSFYVEARGGVQYLHYSYEFLASEEYVENVIGYGDNKKVYTTTVQKWDETSDGNFGLFVTPRLGLVLGKSIALTAGYEWNFLDFKFDKEHRSDYFTVGLSIVM